MGLKANVSFLKGYKAVDDILFLQNLDLKYQTKRLSNLERQIYTTKNISFGEFGDIKIIAHGEYPLMGFESLNLSEYEERIQLIFDPELILSIGLHSTLNLYGYSLIQNKIKVRVNAGSVEGKLFEGGNRTEEEILIFDKYDFDSDKELYFSKDRKRFGGEDMFGEELVTSISSRIFGEPFDKLDMSKIQMRPYLIEE